VPHVNSQLDKFLEAARELDCDEDEGAFEDKLRRIAKMKPKPEVGPTPEVEKAPE